MSKKFIPNGDLDFKNMANSFARNIASDPAKYEMTAEDVTRLTDAVAAYSVAVDAARGGMRSPVTTLRKEETRREAEQIIRQLAHRIRGNPKLTDSDRFAVRIPLRTERPKITPCPQEPPKLRFVRALHEGNGAVPTHELAFGSEMMSNSKPPGAVRLELFVDLVPPDEAVPTHPMANLGSRAWYLRSYTRSPIVLVPPMSRVPMRVVYWGRWADSTGNVGPFSATAVAWIEGGQAFMQVPGAAKVPKLIEVSEAQRPSISLETYRVAVLEVQYQSLHPTALEGPRPMAQLEGPTDDANAEAA